MTLEINKAWGWKGINAIEVIKTNEFGNVIFKTDKKGYWRICPEEILCEKIADSKMDLEKIVADPEFIEDWEMTNLVNIAKEELGELGTSQKYCLKIPAVIGGTYEKTNLGKIKFEELISICGNLGFQIKDLKDGQRINLKIINNGP